MGGGGRAWKLERETRKNGVGKVEKGEDKASVRGMTSCPAMRWITSWYTGNDSLGRTAGFWL